MNTSNSRDKGRVTRISKYFGQQTVMHYDVKLENYINDWNLTEQELKHLTGHFLRNWSLLELVDKLVTDKDSGVMKVSLWRTDYLPVFQGDQAVWDRICYLAVRGRMDTCPVNDKLPMFWLSFRSGVVEGEKFNFVIIQEDKRGAV